MIHVLVIDDDAEFRHTMSILLNRLGYTAYQAADIYQGLQVVSQNSDISIVLMDLYLKEGKCTDSIPRFRLPSSSPQVIVMTGQGDPDSAAQCIENGAWDYMEKPITAPKLSLTLQRAVTYQKEQNARVSLNRIQQEGLIGISPNFISCLEQLGLMASHSSNVLLYGETGTGKELFARAIHNCSSRADRAFVALDCTSLPETLAESILQGHTRGAFTGANTAKSGMVKQADGGTLFLDEIGELPQHLQKSFLRILQERTVRPLGSSKEESSDFRLIAATNRNLDQMVARGEFRQDLYYRLVTSQIILPPLRNRKEDIRPLVQSFMAQACKEYGLEAKELSSDFINALYNSDWPGNIRELINVVYASLASAQNATTLYPHHLPVNFRAQVVKQAVAQNHQTGPEEGSSAQSTPWLEFKCLLPSLNGQGPPTLKEARNHVVNQLEAAYLHKVVQHTQGDMQQACQLADLSKPRCYELLKKHQIKRPVDDNTT